MNMVRPIDGQQSFNETPSGHAIEVAQGAGRAPAPVVESHAVDASALVPARHRPIARVSGALQPPAQGAGDEAADRACARQWGAFILGYMVGGFSLLGPLGILGLHLMSKGYDEYTEALNNYCQQFCQTTPYVYAGTLAACAAYWEQQNVLQTPLVCDPNHPNQCTTFQFSTTAGDDLTTRGRNMCLGGVFGGMGAGLLVGGAAALLMVWRRRSQAGQNVGAAV